MAQNKRNEFIFEEKFIPKEYNQDAIINNFQNFYDLNPENIIINNPYNFNSALDIIDKFALEDFKTNSNEIVQKEIDLDYLHDKTGVNFSLNNIQFLTPKTCRNKYEYILLNDFKKEDYIGIPKYEISSKEIINTGINIKIYKKEDSKKEVNIKCIVNYEKFAYIHQNFELIFLSTKKKIYIKIIQKKIKNSLIMKISCFLFEISKMK